MSTNIKKTYINKPNDGKRYYKYCNKWIAYSDSKGILKNSVNIQLNRALSPSDTSYDPWTDPKRPNP